MRKNIIPLFIIFSCFFTSNLFSQSLEEAKRLFQNKEYERAKPAFQRLVKNNPNNASYNYWYGACCYETDEKDIAEKYLLVGAKRKVQEAFRYLGQLYFDQYRFEESEEYYDEYIGILRKAKKSTEEFEISSQKAKLGARMLKGVEEVTFIDSFVVDKNNFLEAYKISGESGQIHPYSFYFNNDISHEGIVYETELKNKLYYADLNPENNLNIYSRTKHVGEWSKPIALPENINTESNQNYPYVLSDGVTLYYGSDGENSLGGYDIFVTRYNTNTDTYMLPDNIGMPFNSPFNDYMFAIDEYNNLGWFASDRYQPNDKVCIYVFIPNTSKQIYNYENTDNTLIRNAAKINSIEETWKNDSEVKSAKQRLASIKYYKPEEKKSQDFMFVIDDNTIYYTLSDFTSQKGRTLFQDWQKKQQDYQKLADQLETQRNQFSTSNAAARKNLTPGILDLEKRVEQMEIEIKQMEVNIRNEENKNLNK